MLYPQAEYYSVTTERDDGSEFDLGYEPDDALTLAEAREIAHCHVDAQIWAHGRFPGAKASVRWRVYSNA